MRRDEKNRKRERRRRKEGVTEPHSCDKKRRGTGALPVPAGGGAKPRANASSKVMGWRVWQKARASRETRHKVMTGPNGTAGRAVNGKHWRGECGEDKGVHREKTPVPAHRTAIRRALRDWQRGKRNQLDTQSTAIYGKRVKPERGSRTLRQPAGSRLNLERPIARPIARNITIRSCPRTLGSIGRRERAWRELECTRTDLVDDQKAHATPRAISSREANLDRDARPQTHALSHIMAQDDGSGGRMDEAGRRLAPRDGGHARESAHARVDLRNGGRECHHARRPDDKSC